jgi:hypothetical protein
MLRSTPTSRILPTSARISPVCALAIALISSGCILPPAATVPPPPPDPVTKYYVASVDTLATTSTHDTEEGLRKLDDRASTALRPGITVAFFPPDQCRDIAAADVKATAESAELANRCGVLISALENAVADRYSVVSWQTLKPRGASEDPYVKAANRNVDVIFEVDSFGMNEVGQSAINNLRIDFGVQTNASDRQSIVLESDVLPVVANRCKNGVEQIVQERAQAGMVGSFTGAIKAVEVSSGRAIMYYQKTLTNEPGEQSKSGGYEWYFKSEGQSNYVKPVVPPPTFSPLQRGGAALTILGAVMLVAGGALRFAVFTPEILDNGAKVYKQPGTAVFGGMFLTGFFVTGGGIAMMVLGNRKAKRTPPPVIPVADTTPTYASPGDVLCVQPTTPPWLEPGPQWQAPAAEGGSSYSFSESTHVGVDGARARENALRQGVIDDFTKELGKLTGE